MRISERCYAVMVPGHGPVLRGAAIEAEVTRIECVLRDALR